MKDNRENDWEVGIVEYSRRNGERRGALGPRERLGEAIG